MQITEASSGDSKGDPGENDRNGEDSFTPFCTPQHNSRSPAQSYFSVLNSQRPRKLANFQSLQDSLDVYHDAYATLQRARFNSAGERKRHSSLGAGARANHALEEDAAETTDLLPPSPPLQAPRVRHSSCNATNNNHHHHHLPYRNGSSTNSPHHPPARLSVSTVSLKKKTEKDLLTQEMDSLQKLVGRGPSARNYVPCVEMREVLEKPEESSPVGIVEPIRRDFSLEKPSDKAWMKNYVPCVELDRMLGRSQREGSILHEQEIQLKPGQIEQSNDTVVHMYTFGPVQRRRGGLQRVRDEFKRENLGLECKTPHLFVSSQWQQHNRMSCIYLGYRLFWAIYFPMWAVWAWIGSFGYNAPLNMKGYFMLYMTNWGIWTLALDTVIQAINVILHFKKISEEGDATYTKMTRLMKVSWVLSNITGTLHLFITSAYWITVYPNRSDERLNEIGVNTHIMPGLYTLIDVAVSATPRQLLHGYQPSLFLTVYTIFNLIYYLCGGVDYLGRPALYPVLDWTRPGHTIGIMTTVLVLLIPFLHGLICALYAARVKLWRILKISRYVREEDEVEQVDHQGGQEQKV